MVDINPWFLLSPFKGKPELVKFSAVKYFTSNHSECFD